MLGQSQLHLHKPQRRQKACSCRQRRLLRLPLPSLQLWTSHYQPAYLAPTGLTQTSDNNKPRPETALHHGQLHNTCTKDVVLLRPLEVQKIISLKDRQIGIPGLSPTCLTRLLQHPSIHHQPTAPGDVRDRQKAIHFRTTFRANPHLPKLSICSSLDARLNTLVTRVKGATLRRTPLLRLAIQAQTS